MQIGGTLGSLVDEEDSLVDDGVPRWTLVEGTFISNKDTVYCMRLSVRVRDDESARRFFSRRQTIVISDPG